MKKQNQAFLTTPLAPAPWPQAGAQVGWLCVLHKPARKARANKDSMQGNGKDQGYLLFVLECVHVSVLMGTRGQKYQKLPVAP